jgi:hypothetical protein
MAKLGVLLVGVLVSGLWVATSLGRTAEAGHAKRCFGKRADINNSHDADGTPAWTSKFAAHVKS